MNNCLERARILVIDDDAVNREVFSLLLRRQGCRVDTADSGDTALEHLRATEDAVPDIILTDIQMPGVAGGELARQLRETSGPHTRILGMSGSDPGEEVTREFDRFLLKPFGVDELAAAVTGTAAAVNDGIVPEVIALDHAVYRQLASSMKADKLEQLYTLCLSHAERRVTEMRRAAYDGDDAAYRRHAHTIKGGCGMVGAVELQKLATSMENEGLSVTNHVATLDEFVLGCRRLHRILVALANRDPSSSLPGEVTHE
jgi:CheY-like chemotaxis protein